MFECYTVFSIGGENIKTVTLRLSDDLHKKIKLLTVNEEKTLQDYITQLIEKDLNERQSDNKKK
jgi:predicted DNA-binding protein